MPSDQPLTVKLPTASLKRRRYGVPPILAIIVLGMLAPVSFEFFIGEFKITGVRLALFVAIPFLLREILQSKSRIRSFDVLVILHALYITLSSMINMGIEQGLESGGIVSFTYLVSYFSTRYYLRDTETIIRFVNFLVYCAMALAVILAVEAVSGQYVIRRIATALGGVHTGYVEIGRFGLTRAVGPFAHPIHAGLFCVSLISLAWMTARGTITRLLRFVFLFVGGFASVSSGPFLGIATQIGLLAYNHIANRAKLKSKWMLIFAAGAAVFAFLQMTTTHGAIFFLVQKLAFNAWTGFYRTLQWQYAGAEVMNHPIFGIGFGTWTRPNWMMMNDSVDAFWLVIPLRYGLPCVFLLATAIFIIYRHLAKSGNLYGTTIRQKLIQGWAMSFSALVFIGFTVHLWAAIDALFFVLLGMGGSLAAEEKSALARRSSLSSSRISGHRSQ